MKEAKFRTVAARVLFMLCLSVAFACAAGDYMVLTAHEYGPVRQYRVSEDGGTWTFVRDFKARNADGGETPISVATDGDFVYVGDKKDPNTGDASRVHKYTVDGRYVGVFKDLYAVCRLDSIAVDPRREWLYVSAAFGDDATKKNRIYRYRLDDPSVGGACITSGLNVPRQIHFGPDGLLYVANRGSSKVLAYDVSGETPALRFEYAGANTGGVLVDATHVYLLNGASCRRYPVGDTTTYVDIPVAGGSNGFASFRLDGKGYFVSHYANGQVFRADSADAAKPNVKVAQLAGNLCGVCEVPVPVARWTFDEQAHAAAYLNQVDTNAHPVYAYGSLRGGVQGVEGNGLWFDAATCARGVVRNSSGLLSATDNFSVFFWGGFRTAAYAGERIFLANNYGTPTRTALAVNLGQVDGRLTYFHPQNGSTHLKSTSRVDDLKWHHMGVVRRNGVMELWVDGRMECSQADTASVKYDGDWTLGALNGNHNSLRDGFMDDLRFYACAVSPDDIRAFYGRRAPDGAAALPVPAEPPAEPVPDLTAARDLGALVAYSPRHVNPLGAPTFAIDAAGTYWAACSFATSYVFEDAYTLVAKSVDQGATWTVVTNRNIAAASLFLANGQPTLAGMRNARLDATFRVETSADGVNWTARSSSIGTMVPCGGRVLAQDGLFWMPVAGGFATFGYANGTITDPFTVQSLARGAFQPNTQYGQPLAAAIYPREGGLEALVPVTATRVGSITRAAGLVHRVPLGAGTPTIAETFTFPGGAKRFDVVYDETTRRWWAVTLPERDQPENVLPQDVDHVLALYSSADAKTWISHGDVLTASRDAVQFGVPSIQIAGDDLVVVFAASVPDRLGTRAAACFNCLLCRRIGNFRARPAVPVETNRYLLVADIRGNGVNRYCRAANGEFVYGGCLVPRGTYAGLPLELPHGLCATADRFYVSELDGTNVFEFTRSGAFSRVVASFWTPDDSQAIDALAVSKDGRYLYCSDMVKTHRIWRVDLRTLEKVDWIPPESGLVSRVRGMVPMPDGGLVVSDREQNRVVRFNADGTLREVLTAAVSYSQGLGYDAKRDVFYVNSSTFTYRLPNRADAKLEEVCGHGAFSYACLGGMVYDGSWENGCIAETTPDPPRTSTGAWANNVVIAGGQNMCRLAVVEIPTASAILVR